jgi:lysophospholipase L1-like esterase
MPTLTVNRGDAVHFAGDSITNVGFSGGWWPQFPGLIDQIQAHWRPVSGGQATLGGGSTSATVLGTAATLLTPAPNLLTVTSHGVVGAKVADVAAAVAAYITSFAPTKVFLLIGINDASAGTVPATFGTSYASVLSQCVASIPALAGNIACVSPVCYNEQWQPVGSGGPWGLNTFDTNIANLIAQIQTAASNAGQPYIDTRNAMGTWLTTHNGASPGVTQGIATVDGVHLNNVGKAVVCNAVASQISVGA